MPIYEFLCSKCKRRFRKLVGVVSGSTQIRCPHCQSEDFMRQISRFARVRNEDDAIDSLADEMESVGDTDDPAALRHVMQRMGSEMGEDLGGEFDQMMEEESAQNSSEDEDY
ncbi:MAG TPA: zinc ribbon domain-containing protein [Chthonomonadales bacterium]|nr:zinc ribbon domain-containing protein [Chthonomonadales bacterium]